MTMAQRTLLVPGTQATTLRDGDGNLVYNAVRVQLIIGRDDLGDRTGDQVAQLLGMEHDPGQLAPKRTSLEDGTEVRTGAVLRTPYDGLPVTDWFRYDWRSDLRYNAKKLLRFLQDSSPEGGRWNLIGHSQGGLLIVLASKLAGEPREFAKLVGRVVLVGTPLAGTMRATEAILFGRDDLGADLKPAILAAARTWPALYQMLPAWPAVRGKDNRSPLPEDAQFTQPGGWPGLLDVENGIQSHLLQRARETQALLTGPFSHLAPGVDTLVIFGKHQKTPISVPRSGQTIKNEYRNQQGDSLVPEKLSQSFLGSPVHDRRIIYTGRVRAHAFLCIDEDVQRDIKTFFRQPLPPVPSV
jgi:pimeloyl-ACP methyl ester carboxylesterase